MKLFKPTFWQRKYSLLAFFLLPFSVFFQFFLILRKNLKKKIKFNIPIICVGNIYLGGTGKTPLSIKISEILKKSNKKTAIVKKFYKAHEDEFRLIESKKIKLFKNISRAVAIKQAQTEEFDCVILDDGFQDTSIVKNLSIVCFNGSQLIGNGMTLPSGPLRESLSSLKNSKIVVINGNFNEDFEKKIKNISKDISIYYSEYMTANINEFTNQNLLAFAGIGNPNNFFDLLEKNNLSVIKKMAYPDHYNYSIKDLDNLIEYSRNNRLKIITTEKDYFRIEGYKFPEIRYLDIKLEIKKKDKFEEEIKKCLL